VHEFQKRCKTYQDARRYDNKEGALHKADAERYLRQLRVLEEDFGSNVLSLKVANDEVERLQKKLEGYDSVAHELDQVIGYRARIGDLEKSLTKSQALVASYQVCTVLNYKQQLLIEKTG
jgi:hypothetical protein